jgi:hypothetical protein
VQKESMKTPPARSPCPFCGKLSWRFFRDPGTHATQVECASCGARGPLCIPSEEEAFAAWSERASNKSELPDNMAALIVEDILTDLKGRKELRQIWDRLDENTQHEILKTWETMALKVIEANRV